MPGLVPASTSWTHDQIVDRRDKPGHDDPGLGEFRIALLLARIEDVRLEEELLGLFEEQLARRLIAEAIGLAGIDRAHRAVGLDLLAQGKPHHAFAAELSFGRPGGAHRRGEAEDKKAPPPRRRYLQPSSFATPPRA